MLRSHRILHRYVIQEFLRILGLSLSSLVLIYMVVLFFEKMSRGNTSGLKSSSQEVRNAFQ